MPPQGPGVQTEREKRAAGAKALVICGFCGTTEVVP